MSTLNDTPRSDRLHIGIFGKRNSGKSSLINAVTNQSIAIVSEVAGTTADPVYKTMEIKGIGPCVLIDTAGYDDDGELGELRVEKTRKAAERTEIAIILLSTDEELEWINYFEERKTPVVCVLNKADLPNAKKDAEEIFNKFGIKPLLVSAKTKEGVKELIDKIIEVLPPDFGEKLITGNLVDNGDSVLLVMPQDIQAPKGRLILPQVQTLRELLDKKCIIMSCTGDKYKEALDAMKEPPKLIITDSQIFGKVYAGKPEKSLVSSFSVLYGGYKGDVDFFARSAAKIDELTENSRVLIAEACTHAPLAEDIGREQIPRYLRKKCGENIKIDIKSGPDFPEDLRCYDLIIHCGACMFNRKYLMSRVAAAQEANVPMTNYGIFIAHMNGILDKISY